MLDDDATYLYVGYLRSGFESFLEGFAPPHFPAEITTFQVELDELYLMDTFSAQFNTSGGQKLRNSRSK